MTLNTLDPMKDKVAGLQSGLLSRLHYVNNKIREKRKQNETIEAWVALRKVVDKLYSKSLYIKGSDEYDLVFKEYKSLMDPS